MVMMASHEFECVVCGLPVTEYYLVRDEVWTSAGFVNGVAHLECLEKKLGRKLIIEDFTHAMGNKALLKGYGMGREAPR